MREFSALLAAEIQTWPKVTTKPMFGFTAFYRGGNIFAALPKTRALLSGNAFMFKLLAPSLVLRRQLDSDARILPTDFAAAKWFAMELETGKDLADALRWLEKAYEAAG